MSCSSSSSVSLLQLQRPARARSLNRKTDGGVRRDATEAGGTCAAAPLGPQASVSHSMTPADQSHDCSERCSSPTPSSSSGIHYLNVDPTCSMSTDLAESEMAREDSLYSSCASLRSVAAGALGQALPKHKWQPDSDSGLCSFKLCSTIFGPPTYFSLGPRRHHCRLCGQLYCHDHSRTRAPVSTVDKNGATVIFRARVCDDCVDKKASDVALSRTASMDTNSSQVSEFLVTPSESAIEAHSILPKSSAPDADDVHDDEIPPSPAVEPWMGRDGILSLYPLAANASRSSIKRTPSAPPLFAPSRFERRAARDKEAERLTVRQRRMGRENSFLLSGSAGDSDDEGSVDGILIRDGPICYRAKAGRCPARVMSTTDMSAIFQ